MMITSPKKARKFFEAKMFFTTGPIELNGMITNNEDINIVDVRASEDYAKGHVPGAVNLPKEKWSTLAGLMSSKTNVIYCYSEDCHLAAAAAKEFAEQDFMVMELQGGFEQWEHANLPIET